MTIEELSTTVKPSAEIENDESHITFASLVNFLLTILFTF